MWKKTYDFLILKSIERPVSKSNIWCSKNTFGQPVSVYLCKHVIIAWIFHIISNIVLITSKENPLRGHLSQVSHMPWCDPYK